MDERESRNVLLDLRFAMHQVVWAGGVEGGVLACGAQSETFRSFFVLLLV